LQRRGATNTQQKGRLGKAITAFKEVIMLRELLAAQQVIPAIRNYRNFCEALTVPNVKVLFLLYGDINMLADAIKQAKAYGKMLVVHIDLLEGVGKDEAGVKHVASCGVEGIITTRSYMTKQAKKERMIAIQRLFIIDSEALKNGLKQISDSKPDAIEILPATVQSRIVQNISEAAPGLPIIGGGLIQSPSELQEALMKGFVAISTNNAALWTTRQTTQENNEYSKDSYLKEVDTSKGPRYDCNIGFTVVT